MSDKQWGAKSMFDVIGDRLARRLLVLLSEERTDVDTLAERLDASPPTIYRRLDVLTEYDLVEEHREVAADGHHYKTFETAVEAISIAIADGAIEVDVTVDQSLIDRFDSFWSDLQSSSPSDGDAAPSGAADPAPEWTVNYE